MGCNCDRQLERECADLQRRLKESQSDLRQYADGYVTKREHDDLRARLEQAEARCRFYEDAMRKALPIVESMQAIIKAEAQGTTIENGEKT